MASNSNCGDTVKLSAEEKAEIEEQFTLVSDNLHENLIRRRQYRRFKDKF